MSYCIVAVLWCLLGSIVWARAVRCSWELYRCRKADEILAAAFREHEEAQIEHAAARHYWMKVRQERRRRNP